MEGKRGSYQPRGLSPHPTMGVGRVWAILTPSSFLGVGIQSEPLP